MWVYDTFENLNFRFLMSSLMFSRWFKNPNVRFLMIWKRTSWGLKMSLQIACSMLNDSCHALCMYSTVYYECRAGSGLVPGPPRPHHPPSCFPHYPSPSRPCPGCVFLWEMSISFWAPPEQDGTIQILQKHIAEETMQVNDRRSAAKSKPYCVWVCFHFNYESFCTDACSRCHHPDATHTKCGLQYLIVFLRRLLA